MNKIALLMSGIALTFASCQTLDRLTQFDVNYTATFSVPGVISVNTPVSVSSPAITTNIQTAASNNTTTTDLIESVNLTSAVLSVTAPAGQSLDFLSSLRVFVSASGESEIELASKLNITDSGSATLTLDPTSENLKRFLIKPEIMIRTEVTTDQIITQSIDMSLAVRYHIDAKILGL
jgi:hypothetical protein